MGIRKRGETPRTWTAILKAEARRFHEEEDGATLIFAAATFFTLTVAIMFVMHIGLISSDRLQIQGAADAAAYSGALVEANSLNALGQVNDSLTYVNYIAMRHTLDLVVYMLTLHQYTRGDFRSPTATGAHGYAIMGGSPGGTWEGNARIDLVGEHINGTWTYDELLFWRADLNAAARVVVNATPGLVRKTASEVALANGASHIGFSDELDKAWKVGEDTEGFSEKGYKTNDDEYVPSMYQRYEKRGVAQITVAASGPTIDTDPRNLPRTDWYDAATGKIDEYTQTRLCWHEKDWKHQGSSQGTNTHGQSTPYGKYRANNPHSAPNAHWHHGHQHVVVDSSSGIAIPRLLGHAPATFPRFLPDKRRGGGHREDDPKVHANPSMPLHPQDWWRATMEHHAVYECDNCNWPARNGYWPNPDPAAEWAEILASSEEYGNLRKDLSRLLNDNKPSPLVLRGPLLRSGLTVVTYRPSRGFEAGSLFPESPWGMIGIASAQVGIETPQGVIPLRSMASGKATYKDAAGTTVDVPYWESGGNTDAGANQNLFYDPDLGKKEGFHFSARLVPIARKLTWRKDNENGEGLKRLLTNASNWYDTETLKLSAPPIGALSDYITVEDRAGLEAFWH
ncbi:MAG: hypothetical protein JKY65_16080 [Planctomycetes bacterium]|nr:hypothetical protein [Planctomycetota bacterium]